MANGGPFVTSLPLELSRLIQSADSLDIQMQASITTSACKLRGVLLYRTNALG